MRPYLSNITALRGIAATLVVILHFDFFFGAIIPRGITGFIDKLYLMVDMFFILSGFVMCYVYQDSFEKKPLSVNYKRFLLLRLARIYPLHFITLLVEVVICCLYLLTDTFSQLPATRQYSYQWQALPMQLFFLDTLGLFNFVTWNSPAWSLSAEWWAYIVFPFLLLTLKFKRVILFLMPVFFIGTWLLCEFYLAGIQPFLSNPGKATDQSLNVIWHWGALRGIAGFAAGMFIFELFKMGALRALLANGRAFILVCILAVLAMHFKLWDTLIVTLFSVIILSAAYGSAGIDKVFKINLLQKLGDWSFSIYLWHMVLFNIFWSFFIMQSDEQAKGLPRMFEGDYLTANLVMFGLLLLVVFIGKLSNQYIEKPSRQYLRKRIDGSNSNAD